MQYALQAVCQFGENIDIFSRVLIQRKNREAVAQIQLITDTGFA